MAQDPQYNITCYRPNGTAVGVNSVRGRCPLGLTRQPPTSPVSQAVSSSDDIANYTTGGGGDYNYNISRPEDFDLEPIIEFLKAVLQHALASFRRNCRPSALS